MKHFLILMKHFLYFKETLPIYEIILQQNIIYRKGWMVYRNGI